MSVQSPTATLLCHRLHAHNERQQTGCNDDADSSIEKVMWPAERDSWDWHFNNHLIRNHKVWTK